MDTLSGIATRDAEAAQGANATPIVGLRLVMVSPSICGPSDPTQTKGLRREVAGLILDAICAVAEGSDAQYLPVTMLVNCKTDSDHAPPCNAIDAFSCAAKARGIAVKGGGFDLDWRGGGKSKFPAGIFRLARGARAP